MGNTPLPMLDVPEPDGTPSADLWVIVCQTRPKVLALDQANGPWSCHPSDALVLSLDQALPLALAYEAAGEPVALVRANAASREWLMLVTDWPAGCNFADD